MQGRAAAVYVAFFLLVAVGGFAFGATAEAPSASIDAEFDLQEGQSFDVDGTTYTLESAEASEEGPGSAELSYVNEEGTITETWAVGDNVTYQGQQYAVEVPDGEEPMVVLNRTGDRETFSEGDTLTYDGNETTVDSVSEDEVTVSWTGPVDEEIAMTEGAPAEIGGTEYVAHVPGGGTAQLTSDIEGYNSEIDRVETVTMRINSGWVVGILSSLAGLLLLAMAFLPRKEL